ncbi:MAG: helix-turn-helix transcriptional regulator [Clostridiales bacterium]|nr:helix-turn-helix transcriptional regulator [Clostridiales bacterium]
MIINNVGYNHNHDADFFINRPKGSGDFLLLLLKTDALFTLNGKNIKVDKNSLFIYKKGTPQYYRCIPQEIFSNDWIHFLFENDEEQEFLSRGIPYDTPIKIDNLYFLSFCIKSLAYETYSTNLYKNDNIYKYMFLMFNKISEELNNNSTIIPGTYYEMLSTIRNKIYSRPYELRTIESTAHEVRMSKSNFQLQYKKHFGVSFIQDLINSKMEYAKKLLLCTNLSISSISKQCGYKHYAHFTRQFKKNNGVTPMEYRRSKG